MLTNLIKAGVILLTGLCLPSWSKTYAQDAQDVERPALFLVVENGGVVTDRAAASEAINFTLGELAQLRRRREGRGTAIHIILSANPTEVTWSGTPQQLYEQGQQVLDAITFRDTCSDLVLAWDQVALTARITRPSTLSLIGIGPMIHAGFPCDQAETTISLPQPVPDGLKLAELTAEAGFLRLMNVHADQDEAYLDYLEGAGAVARAIAGELDFDLLDKARTRARLGRILGGR